jgi:hypothetical protein
MPWCKRTSKAACQLFRLRHTHGAATIYRFCDSPDIGLLMRGHYRPSVPLARILREAEWKPLAAVVDDRSKSISFVV